MAFGALMPPSFAQPPASAPGDDEPIVSDSAFEDALPPLDPALIEPLEQIEGLDQEALEARPFPPIPGPVEETPLEDPALAEPLPPLSTFRTEPIQDVAGVPADGEALERIRYTLVVEGLNEAGLERRFRSFSALEDARGEAVNGAMIAARAREDEVLAVRLLRSEGYYDAAVSSAITQAPDQPDRLTVTISAAAGNRYSFGDIRIIGPGTQPPEMARAALPLEEGMPIIAVDVEAAEANVMLRLPQQGYPFPELGLRDIELDPTTRLGVYTLPLDPGPRASFRSVTTEGDLAFDADHVELLARFGQDDLYDRRLVDDLREAMAATRLFNSVSAEPVRTGETAPDGTEYVDILVRQQAGPARSIDGSIGYNTGEGPRIEAAWEHRNLFPPEGALRIAAIGGTNEQSASVRLRRNNWRRRDQALWFQFEVGRRNYTAFEGYTTRLFGTVARESTPIWQKRWTYAFGAEVLATNEARIGRPRLSLSDAYFIGGVFGQVGYDRSNSLLDPTRGYRLTARVNPEVSLNQGNDFYLRNLIDGSAYYPVGDFVIAGRVRLGSITGIGRDALAPSRRFYAGGGGSVRGFGFQELGPKEIIPNPDFDPDDPDGAPATLAIPLGGRSVNEFAIEGRYRFGDYGVVAFVDAGQVYESEYPRFSNLRYGVGIGGRLYTNFGPVRVDIATPINRQQGESKISIYVSIGQAF
jgi:translocation and assembly module TamA